MIMTVMDCCSPLLLRTINLSKLISVLFSVYPIARPVLNATVGQWRSSYRTFNILKFSFLFRETKLIQNWHKIIKQIPPKTGNAFRTATACSIVLLSVSKQYYQCLQSELFLSFFVVFPHARRVQCPVQCPPHLLCWS